MTELANLTEEMVMTAKVEDLKEILRRRGLDITGRKTDLQDRAKDWLKANPKVRRRRRMVLVKLLIARMVDRKRRL